MANVLLERFKGDTYPIEATLTRDGTWSLSGSTVKMSFEFDDAITHTFTGTITDYGTKTVEFVPTAAAVASARHGMFDIQVDDGTYIATHIRGTVRILEDVTPES